MVSGSAAVPPSARAQGAGPPPWALALATLCKARLGQGNRRAGWMRCPPTGPAPPPRHAPLATARPSQQAPPRAPPLHPDRAPTRQPRPQGHSAPSPTGPALGHAPLWDTPLRPDTPPTRQPRPPGPQRPVLAAPLHAPGRKLQRGVPPMLRVHSSRVLAFVGTRGHA